MNKEQAEKLAKLMRKAGVNVQVMQCGSEEKEGKSDSPEDTLGKIAKEFMEAISKKADEVSQSDQSIKEDKASEDTKPAYANHAFEGLKELAGRVNLFVEHPMLTNLSTHEAVATLELVEVMMDDLVEHNPNFIAAANEDAATRVYLNSIFYAVDLMMKAKADAGLLIKPDATVKVNSAE